MGWPAEGRTRWIGLLAHPLHKHRTRKPPALVMSHEAPQPAPAAPSPPVVIPLRGRVEPTQARVVAIASGKGGVGKTNLAANFALTLGRLGVRVLAVDGDLGLANLDIVLGLAPSHTSLDILSGDVDIEEVLVPAKNNVWLLPGCPGSDEANNLEDLRRYDLMTAIDTLDGRFDTVVIDTGSGLGRNTLGFCAAAEEVLLVITPEPTGLSDGLGMLRTLGRKHGVRSVKVVANMVSNSAEGEMAFEQLQTMCNRALDVRLEYLGAVPYDSSVGRAIMRGQPTHEVYPDSPFCQAVTRVAERFLASTQRGARPGASQIFWRRLLRQREHGAK